MDRETGKKHTGKCFDCEGSLELVEVDFKKDTKVMKCLNCGLLHHYKKDLLGKWKLLKVTKFSGEEVSS
jgi:uncharacterized Zn finger protein